MDEATKQFVLMVKKLAAAFLQDVAAIWDKVQRNPMFQHRPFNTPEFHQFRCVHLRSCVADIALCRQDLKRAMSDAPANELRVHAETYEQRGDVAQAQVLRNVVGTILAARQGSELGTASLGRAQDVAGGVRLIGTPARHIREIHHQVCRDSGGVPSQAAAAPSTPPRRASSQRAIEHHDSDDDAIMPNADDDDFIMPTVPPQHDNLDPETWPQNPVDIPQFVASIQPARNYRTVQELADEYFRGTAQRPPLRDVDRLYGQARGKGLSWRSAKYQGNRAFNTDFAKRLVVWEYLDNYGENREVGIRKLQDDVDRHFKHTDPESRSWSDLVWLMDYLKRQRPGHEGRSKRAQEAAKTRAENKRARVHTTT